jgi:hypothetical protein
MSFVMAYQCILLIDFLCFDDVLLGVCQEQLYNLLDELE